MSSPGTEPVTEAGERSRTIVWGLGRFGGGLAALRHLLAAGHRVDVMDRRDPAELATALEAAGLAGRGIALLPETPASLEGAALVVVNPAVRPEHPLLAEIQQRGIRVTQELELALAAFAGRVIAVTGTNGKSSTAAMLHHLLCAAGQPALLAGNIGRSLLEDLAEDGAPGSGRIAVVEISSFQAARLGAEPRFDALLVTNLAEDHVDWHGDLERYHADKMRLALALRPGGVVLGHAHDAALVALSQGAPWPALLLGNAPGLPELSPDRAIVRAGTTLLPATLSWGAASPLHNPAMRENAALALAALQFLGHDPAAHVAALRDFRGLPHRLERLPSRFGIEFVDNGISTVARSSEVAIDELSAERAVHWVCGGHPKSPELAAHVACARSCASVHVFGEVAPRLVEALDADADAPPCTGPHADLRGALRAACRRAVAGDVVLFSPAFSSHDAYPNFAVRAAEARDFWAQFEPR